MSAAERLRISELEAEVDRLKTERDHARSFVPAMLARAEKAEAEVDRLRAENERLQQALDGIGTALGCAQNGVITQQEAWRQIEENLRAVHPDGPGLAAGYAVVNRSELDALRQQVADRDRQITALMEAARP